MIVSREQQLGIREEVDVVQVRREVRRWAEEMRFSLVEQTKMVTAASELARNTMIYGGGGSVKLRAVSNGRLTGLQLVFEDQGPGIPDISLALQDGYTTGSGLGLGLGGAKRLVSEFSIESKPGAGTRVVATRWK